MRMTRKTMFAVMLGAVLLAVWTLRAATPVKVMILDGQSAGAYHDWQHVTPVLKKELDETGLFQVDVVTAPPSGGDFSQFRPDFNKYRVIVLNYDGPDWPADLKSAFETYVKNGGGVVAV